MNKQKTSTPAATAVLNRVLRYMLHYYKVPFALVIVCIVITAIATVAGSTFPQTLVDDYITPMLESGSRDFSGLARDLTRLACIMGIGVVAAFSYNRIMVSVSQGTMRRLRNELFSKMESLPIKYFDTHAHVDIMSVYTNDVDTLRQLLSQSIPQIINSVITMAATLVTMIVLNPTLTIISLLTAVVMLTVTKNFSKLSGKYYVRQQRDLGIVDGFIEEMLDGQKVVKVFCHEEAAKADFRKVNDALRDSANMANRYAHAHQFQYRLAELCPGGDCGRDSGYQRPGRCDTRYSHHVREPQQEFYQPHHAGQHADELCDHRSSRCPAGL